MNQREARHGTRRRVARGRGAASRALAGAYLRLRKSCTMPASKACGLLWLPPAIR